MSTTPESGARSGTVAYLTKRFPRLSETFILDEILGLEAAGVPIRLYALADPRETVVQPDVGRVASPVVTLHAGGGWGERLTSARATLLAHTRLLRREPRRYVRVLAYLVRKRRHRSTWRHFVEAGRLAGLLERDHARHLHAAFAHGPASVAHLVHLLTGIPFSFAAHAKDLYVSAPDLLARKVAASTFVLACSASAAERLRQLAGPAADRIVLARHGVDTSRFAPAGAGSRTVLQPLRVLAVGRLVDKKGYPVLLEALAQVTGTGRCVACRIIGSGPARQRLEEEVTRLGLGGVVTLVGARTQLEVAAASHDADVFVQASVVLADGDRDGIPNALLEAMASGLAVVATRVGGIPEVIPDGAGLLVPAGDVGAVALALIRLADDPDLARQLGAAARRHVIDQLDRLVCARAIALLFGVAPSGIAPSVGAG
ncbi:MAG TPA: glycosyltransferase [Verrucomicrobiae bacterium]|nr:glycosyltransferase [Verrucomicrobiae bacterium]